MSSLDLENQSTYKIVVTLIVSALGFYLATTTSQAVNSTIDYVMPKNQNDLKQKWMAFFIALLVVLFFIKVIHDYITPFI
jgi:succinate dehydrogenase hydrophobic anchor subunit